MSERELADAILSRFKRMTANARIAKIRKLAGQSESYGNFIRETFPDLYQEAFPAEESSESSQ
jgi:hypothetical protein